MKSRIFWTIALASIVITWGCGDDSGTNTVTKSEAGDACTKKSDCADGLVCADGMCVTKVGLDEDCSGEYVSCEEGECVDGTCQVVTVTKPAGSRCAERSECSEGLDCIDGFCGTRISLGEDCTGAFAYCEEGECVDGTCQKASDLKPAGGTCAARSECADGLDCIWGVCGTGVGLGEDCSGEFVFCVEGECLDGTCQNPPEQPDLVACSEDAPCEAPLRCGGDGYCHEPAEPGGECGKTVPCPEGQFCGMDGFCSDLLDLGHACTDHSECAGDAICDNVCMIFGREIGSACSEFEQCVKTADCVDNVCRVSVKDGESCDENHLCPEGDICFTYAGSSVCSVNHGACQSDDDCWGDSYCCLDDSCSPKEFCVSYGEGPRGNQNEACEFSNEHRIFEAAIQCEWKAPETTDPYPNHANVLMTPLVMNTPHDSGKAQEIIFTTYNNTDGGAPSGQGSDIRFYGVIRIINGETCELLESIFDDNNHIIGGSNLAMADVDGDGFVEIFASRGTAQHAGNGGGLVAFHWDKEAGKYVTWWQTKQHSGNLNWGGPAIHDLNNDGVPEIIGYGGEVFNTLTGERLNSGQGAIAELYYTPTLGDLDNDGAVEIIGTVNTYRWDSSKNQWVVAYTKKTSTGIHPAFADFGMRNTDGSFNPNILDGRAEIVNCGTGIVQISTLEGENVLLVTGLSGGGPCTIGDFDGDGFPEVATAFGDSYRIFDPGSGSSILWSKLSQDASSASTGSSLFDFDGDGAMEAVYADECYTRVYDGRTGDVLFSAYRSSATWHENPVIADVDNDDAAEIVVGSNNAMTCKSPDPIHRGIRCAKDEDCKSGICRVGLCRCTTNDECNWRTDQSGKLLNEYGCVGTLTAEDQPAEGNVCRAIRSNSERVTGVRVMKDRLDRWVSSRNIWNQHAYSITNVNDDQTVPSTSQWLQNFLASALNNFRQNKQGKVAANYAPDITGRFVGETCARDGDVVLLGAEVCNRGMKIIASLMPASFYAYGHDEEGKETYQHLCTSYTSENVPVGGCLHVTCTIDDVITGDVVLIVNDDGKGGRTSIECNEKNNGDRTTIKDCPVVIN